MKVARWIVGSLSAVACALPYVELVDSTGSGGGGGKGGNGGGAASGGTGGDGAGETSSGGSAGNGGKGGDIGGGEGGDAGATGGDSGEAGMGGAQAGSGATGGRATGGAGGAMGGAGAGGTAGGAGVGGAMGGAGAGGVMGGAGAGGAMGGAGTGGAMGGAGAGGTGGGAGACTFPSAQSAWPDSPTIFCTDGSIAGTCPSSGQTAFGQDGSYARTTNTYTDVNGVVSDSLLGIEWMRGFPGLETWANASDYCDGLMFQGRSDWRLPTRLELVSIVDYGRFDPVLDTSVFDAPGGTYRGFWSRTAHATLGQDHWIVNSEEGIVVSRANLLVTQVRCVRGPVVMQPRSELAGCEIIFDSFAGLGWQKWPSGQTFGWTGALAHCEALDQDGFFDWRLPSVKELQTIVDASVFNPAIDANLFPGTPVEMFWTSTAYVNIAANAWVVDFSDGAALHSQATSTAHRVRCVRGG